jgi:probable F420-dependent oxidoreductase
MKFAVRVPANFLYRAITSPWEADLSPEDSLRFARKADELGFDWLWVAEHIIQLPEMVPIMGPRFYEAVSAAAVLLGATKRIGLLTYVSVLPYHNPLVYAKAISTVDFLSGGRFTLGLGAGYLQPEFEALNAPFEERGRRCDEYIRVLKELWTKDRPSFQGEFIQFEDVVFEPKPFQKPHPRIFVAGDARPVQRRAANLGDGWLPWLTIPEEVPDCLSYMKAQPGMQDRSRPFEVLLLLADFPPEDRVNLSRFRIPRERDEVTELIERLRAAGATGAIVHLPLTSCLDECLEWVEWFSEEIIPTYNPDFPGGS